MVNNNENSVFLNCCRLDFKNRSILEFELKTVVGVLLTMLNELIDILQNIFLERLHGINGKNQKV